MEFIIYITFFLVFCWAVFASVFAFQLHKENEDFARRLGRFVPNQDIVLSEIVSEIRSKIVTLYKEKYPKIRYAFVELDRILKIIPIKIRFK